MTHNFNYDSSRKAIVQKMISSNKSNGRNDFFCDICLNVFKNLNGLTIHVGRNHKVEIKRFLDIGDNNFQDDESKQEDSDSEVFIESDTKKTEVSGNQVVDDAARCSTSLNVSQNSNPNSIKTLINK